MAGDVASKCLGSVYGLIVSSETRFRDFAPAPSTSRPDIEIYRDTLDWDDPRNPPKIDDYLRGQPDDIWMNIPGKLTMRIQAGKTIAYQPDPAATTSEIQAFLLGSGLGALLVQRGGLLLHANAIATPSGRAIVSLGPSGAGKSTLAAAMMQRGFSPLCDDVCAIGRGNLIQPGLARMKLEETALRQLGIRNDGFERIAASPAKFSVPLPNSPLRGPQAPGLIILLEPAQCSEITTTPLTGIAKFTAIRNNIYRPIFNRALDNEPECLERIKRLSDSVPMFKISRPRERFDMEGLVDQVHLLHHSALSL